VTSDGLYEVPMQWTLALPSPVDIAALRRALQRLCARHSVLRAVPEPPSYLISELADWTTDAASMLQALWCWDSFGGCFVRAYANVLAWAVLHSWPRYRTCSSNMAGFPPILEVDVRSEWEAADIIEHLDFHPPCSFALVRCETPPLNLVALSVSHALSDASAFVPLRSDLVSLYLEESTGQPVCLPELPDGLPVLSARFSAALTLGGGELPDAAPYLGGWESSLPIGWGYRRMIHVRKGAGAALQSACNMLHIPSDVMLIVALACALARCDRLGVVRLTLTVPMRDGPSEGAMVGLFSDWRDLDVCTHELQTLLSVAQQTTDTVRERRWSRGRVAQTSQRLLVNLVAVDRTVDRGVEHRPDLGCMRPPLPSSRVLCSADRPLEIQGWQIGAAPPSWVLSLRLDGTKRPPEWASRFAGAFGSVIEQLAVDPVAPVHYTRGPLSFDM